MNKLSKLTLASFTILTSVALFSTTAFAVNLPRVSPRPKNPGSQAGIRREKIQTRLSDVKLKACQARENGVKQRSIRLTEMANNMLSKFDSIVSRVENYYTNKVVSSGKTVANYDSLVTDIQTKKSAVQTALTTARSNIAGFSCDGSDPKGQMSKFREDMQNVKQALKEYRTSIKNLIVAIHAVTGTENRENSPTNPEATKTSDQGGNK